MSGGLTTWITETMDAIGYLGIGALMFAENLFPPIPSELIMPLAGFNISQGRMAWLPAITAGVVGTILGALPWYYIGRVFNEKRLGGWADRYGKWLGISSEEIHKSVVWFQRHGTKAVFFGRLVPGIRTLISIPAGIEGMALPTFLIYSTLGTAIWVTFLTTFGYFMGANYAKVEEYVGPWSKRILAVLVVAFVIWLVRKQLTQRRKA
ncbi:MAG: DedA family protein [Synechococcales cyanobacterium RU_4_20]|nr:DedA family protein [Synechococcales cyanobacterium RU_4_20]NJR69001.1 DedA family protein [Synechococcales cyanobacterium CRU_2_2]